MKRVALLLGLLALLAAGFAAAGGASPTAKKPPCKKGYKRVKGKCVRVKKTGTTTKTGTTPAPTPPPKSGFASGVYYAKPNGDGTGTIKLIGGSVPNITISTLGGFDVGQVLVWTNGDELHVVSPAGSSKTIVPDGIYDLRHPSLSPDGTKVAVQATQSPPDAGAEDQWNNVYSVNLADGTWTMIAPTGSVPYEGNDLPIWLPSGNEIAYQSTEFTNGQGCVVVDVADASTGAVKRTLRRDGTSGCETQVSPFWESPRVQLAASPDAKKLLLVGALQIYDAQTGAGVGNVHDQVLKALADAGYAPDHRYPSRAGSTPAALAGSFSPDGTKIVFDGAVEKDFHYYQLVMQVNLDGSGFKILAGPFEADEPFVAGNAYSLLNTVWKP